MQFLDRFLRSEPGVRVVTIHRYPLQLCFMRRTSPRSPTVEHLLAPGASTGLADSFRQPVLTAHAHRIPLRIDELNTVSCGAGRAVSDTFASALWALDAMFEMARVGVDGVSIHTFPRTGYELFRVSRANGRWRVAVAPEYYGLAMFAQAAPPGSVVEDLRGRSSLKIWETRAPDGRLRVVLINMSLRRSQLVALRAPRYSGVVTLERLAAPSARSRAGVTLGGQTFDPRTGLLSGRTRVDAVRAADRRYLVNRPPASAALLTLG